jgi:hypothetical protein
MLQRSWFFQLVRSLLVLSLMCAAACRQPAPDPPASPPYLPTATIKDLMQSVVDTNADVVWLSVSTVSSEKGLIETAPKTDEDWATVRHGAIALAEAANLLMIPGRHVARAGEKSETPGVELEPEEMEALINKDRDAWHKRATALHDAALVALQAIEAKDADKVFQVGSQIEEACENCHTHYWYPNEKIPPPTFNLK